ARRSGTGRGASGENVRPSAERREARKASISFRPPVGTSGAVRAFSGWSDHHEGSGFSGVFASAQTVSRQKRRPRVRRRRGTKGRWIPVSDPIIAIFQSTRGHGGVSADSRRKN